VTEIAKRDPQKPLPASLRRLVLPWWTQRATELATALEAAVVAGESHVQVDHRKLPVGTVADMAAEALAIIERLEAEEAAS